MTTSEPGAPNGLADLRPRQASLLLVLVAAFTAVCLWLSQTQPLPPQPLAGGGGDAAMYRRIVSRVGAGENYYDAAGSELRAGGYGLRPVFHWRLPTHYWILARAPHPDLPRTFTSLLAVCAGILVWSALRREGSRGLAAASAASLVLALSCAFLETPLVFAEVWAATLLAVSLAAFAVGAPRTGVTTAVCALLFRELALGYCLACLVLAWRRRRRSELAAWMIGLSLFLAAYALHAWQVTQHSAPEDRFRSDWLELGGLPFVLATAQMHPLLLLLPLWVSALYLPAALLGLASWRSDFGQRATLATLAYLAGFAVFGQPSNAYWGLMAAPFLALGVVRAPKALAELWKAARRHPVQGRGA